SAGGHAKDSTEIETFPSLANALASFPNLVVQRQGAYLVVSVPSVHGGRCTPEIRIDGIPAGANHFIDLQPKEVAAVEVYPRPASVPSGFVPGGKALDCGMIVAWTKYAFRLR